MRRVLILLLMALLLPAVAQARHTHRCWLGLGLYGGPAVNIDARLKDEFNVMGQFGLDVKYYLWKPFSLSGDFNILYGEGRPKRVEWHGDWIEFDSQGVSFWRAYSTDMILRAEIGRYWNFNPYLGVGIGGVYNTIWRRGRYKGEKLSDSYGEWLLKYIGVAGYDVLFNKFVGVRMEGRWTMAPSDDTFVDQRETGYWSGLIGLQIYL